jgi:transposase
VLRVFSWCASLIVLYGRAAIDSARRDGQAAAAPPNLSMNSRRLICLPLKAPGPRSILRRIAQRSLRCVIPFTRQAGRTGEKARSARSLLRVIRDRFEPAASPAMSVVAPKSPYLYRARNLIERFFNKIKQCRRVATRYDKLAANYLAFVKLASIRLWLRANVRALVDVVPHTIVRSSRLRPGKIVFSDAKRLLQQYLPKADLCIAAKDHYSITSSAVASTDGGIVRPSAVAVLRLSTNSNLVGCTTGRSIGFLPFRI